MARNMLDHLENILELPLREVLPKIQHRIVTNTRWFGVKAQKNPIDFWVYQEIIHEMRPDTVIEIGNKWGGSTLALAHLLDLHCHGRVIGVDIDQSKIPKLVRAHPRVHLIEGDAIMCFEKVTRLLENNDRVLVIEDSSHTYENTLAILRTYGDLTRVGDYFIVEDGICHHGLNVGPSPGPFEAIETFVAENPAFAIDRSMESFVITWNPKGFLRRIAE